MPCILRIRIRKKSSRAQDWPPGPVPAVDRYSLLSRSNPHRRPQLMRTKLMRATRPAFAAALISLALPATADEAATAPDAPMLATVEVLGSHIRRVDVETQHPVVTIDRAEILRTGLSSVSDIIQDIVFNGQTLNRH